MDCKSRDESNEPNYDVIRHNRYSNTIENMLYDGLIRLIRFVS